MMELLEFNFPMPPNISNGAHGSWATRHREKTRYVQSLDALQLQGKVPPPPLAPWPNATITSVMHLGNEMDDSNAMRRHKWVEDWLVTRGYLKDDRRKCLTWTGFPQQIIKRDGNYRILIQLRYEESANKTLDSR